MCCLQWSRQQPLERRALRAPVKWDSGVGGAVLKATVIEEGRNLGSHQGTSQVATGVDEGTGTGLPALEGNRSMLLTHSKLGSELCVHTHWKLGSEGVYVHTLEAGICGDICKHILCFVAETNTTVRSNYTPMKAS